MIVTINVDVDAQRDDPTVKLSICERSLLYVSVFSIFLVANPCELDNFLLLYTSLDLYKFPFPPIPILLPVWAIPHPPPKNMCYRVLVVVKLLIRPATPVKKVGQPWSNQSHDRMIPHSLFTSAGTMLLSLRRIK